MTEPSAPPPSTCSNCGSASTGRYCADCGQIRTEPRAPLRELTLEAVRESFALDAKLWVSLRRLLFAPGALARDFLDGRRAAQLPPLRLYLALSLFFFWTWSVDVPDFETLRVVVGSDVVHAPTARASRNVELELLAPSADWLFEPLLGNDLDARRDELRALPPELLVWRFLELTHDALASFWILALPVLAVLLRLLYMRTGFLLYDHAVFLLYEQSLAFGVFGAALLLAGWAGGGLVAVAGWSLAGVLVSLHVLLALRRTYGRSWAGTALRFGLFFSGWAMLWGASLLLAFVYATLNV